MDDYRKTQQFLYNLKKKYSSLIELNKYQRNAYVLQNFFKKYILTPVCNLTKEEISMISGKYRMRCDAIYLNDDLKMIYDNINSDYHEKVCQANKENNSELKKIILESALTYKNDFIQSLFTSSANIKLHIMIDLTKYGINPDGKIYTNDSICYLDKINRERVKKAYDKINPETISGERFDQLLKCSKELCKFYNKKISTK